MQNRCSKKSRKFLDKKTVLESLFYKAAGVRGAKFLKRHFSTGVLRFGT